MQALARDNSTTITCVEAVLWRCRRRLIDDYLPVDGVSVAHIMRLDRISLTKLTYGALSIAAR